MKLEYINLAKRIAGKFASTYGKRMDGNDFFSVAYYTVWTQYPRYNGTGSMTGWLTYKIKCNLLELLRREDPKGKSEKFIRLEDVDPLLISVNGEKLKRFENHQYIEWLMKKAGIKKREKDWLKKYYYLGMTNREIAEVAGGYTEAYILITNKKSLAKLREKVKCGTLSELV